MADVPLRCGLDHDVPRLTEMYEVWLVDRPQDGIAAGQKPDIEACCRQCAHHMQKRGEIPPERRDGLTSETRDHLDKRLHEERAAAVGHSIGPAGFERRVRDQPAPPPPDAQRREGKADVKADVPRYWCALGHEVKLYPNERLTELRIRPVDAPRDTKEFTPIGNGPCCGKCVNDIKTKKDLPPPERTPGLTSEERRTVAAELQRVRQGDARLYGYRRPETPAKVVSVHRCDVGGHNVAAGTDMYRVSGLIKSLDESEEMGNWCKTHWQEVEKTAGNGWLKRDPRVPRSIQRELPPSTAYTVAHYEKQKNLLISAEHMGERVLPAPVVEVTYPPPPPESRSPDQRLDR